MSESGRARIDEAARSAAPAGTGTPRAAATSVQPERRAGRTLARWRPTAPALFGLAIVALAVLMAVLADAIAPARPDTQRLVERLDPPLWLDGTSGYILGSDHLGRDILSRVMHGARVSLVVGLGAVGLAGTIGVTLGLLAGYFGGWWDRLIMRTADVQLAIPSLVLAIAVVAVLQPSMINLIIVLAVTTWVAFARVVRSEVLSLRETVFVEAARVIGATDRRILALHILPNVAASIIVMGSLMLANMILFEAALSFLGLGVPPPTPTWGRMVFDGLNYVVIAWWVPLFPGVAVMLTVLGVNLLGDWLRDVLDPRQAPR